MGSASDLLTNITGTVVSGVVLFKGLDTMEKIVTKGRKNVYKKPKKKKRWV